MSFQYVRKATGERERFSSKKFEESLKRVGAPKHIRQQVVARVRSVVGMDTETEQVERHALQCLLRDDPASACRYHIKKAIWKLGPSGYPFEDYIGAVLAKHGYRTEVGQVMRGRCVEHEVDVVAERGAERIVVECKFHSRRSGRSDVQVPLYMKARFDDLQTKDDRLSSVWIMTNTRFTSEAVKYGRCSGVRLTSWKHPGKESLEQLVESQLSYPITIFPWLPRRSAEGFIARGVVLAEQVLQMSDEALQRAGHLKSNQTRRLISDAEQLFKR